MDEIVTELILTNGGLSGREVNCLTRARVVTLENLLRTSELQMRFHWVDCGAKTAKAIMCAVKELIDTGYCDLEFALHGEITGVS